MLVLGIKVRDRITDFEGRIVARCEWLDSSPQCGVQSEARDGKVPAIVESGKLYSQVGSDITMTLKPPEARAEKDD